MDSFVYNEIDWKVPIERSLLINKNIDHTSLRLYLILLSYARDKITAFPSRERLSEDMGCSVRTVDSTKLKLKEIGLLSWHSIKEGNKLKNIYKLIQYQPILKDRPRELIKNIFSETIDIFKKSYKDFCENVDPFIKEMIYSGWNSSSEYHCSKGDYRNLEAFFRKEGEKGLVKINNAFKLLKDYLSEEIEYGNFYNSDGKEMNPTISLFLKSKMQYDNIIKFAEDKAS